MEGLDTKTRILDAALDLFSVNGYEGVSVKQIAGAVGIKDSSLYKHFPSKQAIFDTLLQNMNDHFEETVTRYQLPQGRMEQVAAKYGQGDLAWLKKGCEAIFVLFLRDPKVSRFRRMLMIEQYRNPRAADIFHSWFFEDAIRFQEALFAEMMRQGFFISAPPQLVALQFYAPLYLLLCRYDRHPEQETEALALLMRHVEQFASVYAVQREVRP